MSAKITFASARPKELRGDATLPALFERMLGKWELKKRFDGKRVAIKMHLGGDKGYSTIHPIFVGILVDALKKAGAKPFITDTAGSVASATRRGYTQEVLGAPIISVAGPAEKYVYSKKIGFRSFKTAELAGNVMDADGLIVFSHGKGHGHSGFGGAIKNIAMGCVDGGTRGKIHRLMSAAFDIDSSKCKGCLLCKDNCPNQAISFKDGKISIFDHACKYCMHCQLACRTGAITIDQAGYQWFQRGMALTTREVLKGFEGGSALFITALLNITPFCDCWGFTTPAIVPDIGILAGDDIVAAETAAIDMIKAQDFIEGSLPPPLKRSGEGHLLQQIHGKDPYLQVNECKKLKMGSDKYNLVKVE
jgi:uncharacterized Fe-S center protein